MKIFFILIFLLSLDVISDNKTSYAQNKIQEGFEGTQFPPQGWSVLNSQPGDGEWKTSGRTSRTGNQCAVSNFTTTGSENILITKRFIPVEGDSLVFYFRQSFWNNYQDTFEVYISTVDSLSIMSGTKLLSMKDSISYPVPFNYEQKSLSLDEYSGQICWLGFRHVNLDGDNIRLDDIFVGQQSYNEVGVVDNVYPKGIVSSCAYEFYIPKATIKNFGNTDQTVPFSITYSITGVTDYSSVTMDTLSAGNSKTINFDTLYIDQPGTYNIKIYTSLQGDQNPLNDTLYSTFNIVNSNYGGGLSINGNYYYSNSNSCSFQAPSHPEFCWKDTTGSVNLILNGEDVSGGLLTGNVDDGYFRLGNILQNNFRIRYFNSLYDSIFISTNGVIGFKNNSALVSSDPSNINSLMLQPVPAFSPFWMNMDFGNTESSGNRLSYKVAGNQLIITYDRSPLKSGNEDDYFSFQICIETGTLLTQNSKLLVQYSKELSGDGFVDKYNNGILPAHLIGMKSTYGNNYMIYRAKDSVDLSTRGPLLNSSMALEIGPADSVLNNKCSSLNLSVLLEACYPLGDTVTVSLRDSEAPFKVVESKKMFLNTDGIINCDFSIPDDQYNYYITIDHRNSIYTWSRESGEVFAFYELDYDFTSGVNMAYGNNMAIFEGRSYIYTGDVNKDDIVDSDDMIDISNGINEFYEGYIPEDLTNDGVTDLDDLVYVYNNVTKFVIISSP